MQADPIGLAGGINGYFYADASPVQNMDVNGEIPFTPFGVVFGAGLNFVTQLIQYQGNVGCVDLWDVFVSGALGGVGPGLFSSGKQAFQRLKSAQNWFLKAGRGRPDLRPGKMNKAWDDIGGVVPIVGTQAGLQMGKFYAKQQAVPVANYCFDDPNICKKVALW